MHPPEVQPKSETEEIFEVEGLDDEAEEDEDEGAAEVEEEEEAGGEEEEEEEGDWEWEYYETDEASKAQPDLDEDAAGGTEAGCFETAGFS
jgi:hypothetical protein